MNWSPPPSLGSVHPGNQQTLSLLRECYQWPSMTQAIQRYIRGCPFCAEVKRSTSALFEDSPDLVNHLGMKHPSHQFVQRPRSESTLVYVGHHGHVVHAQSGAGCWPALAQSIPTQAGGICQEHYPSGDQAQVCAGLVQTRVLPRGQEKSLIGTCGGKGWDSIHCRDGGT